MSPHEWNIFVGGCVAGAGTLTMVEAVWRHFRYRKSRYPKAMRDLASMDSPLPPGNINAVYGKMGVPRRTVTGRELYEERVRNNPELVYPHWIDLDPIRQEAWNRKAAERVDRTPLSDNVNR